MLDKNKSQARVYREQYIKERVRENLDEIPTTARSFEELRNAFKNEPSKPVD